VIEIVTGRHGLRGGGGGGTVGRAIGAVAPWVVPRAAGVDALGGVSAFTDSFADGAPAALSGTATPGCDSV
jgi:hypothetical protein